MIGVWRELRLPEIVVLRGPIGGGLGLGRGMDMIVPDPVLLPPMEGAGLPLPEEAEGE